MTVGRSVYLTKVENYSAKRTVWVHACAGMTVSYSILSRKLAMPFFRRGNSN